MRHLPAVSGRCCATQSDPVARKPRGKHKQSHAFFLKANRPLQYTQVRSLQCNFTYKNECLNKYGDELGLKLWEVTNRIFDQLPLCAVVDEAVYCAHGGIPRSTYSLADIAALPVELVNPEIESPIAQEILWSDPLAQPQFVETGRLQQVDVATCEGYLPNRKRGTAFFFNEEAINR